MLTEAIKASIHESVLCWLATYDGDFPNVSPKEIFTYFNDKIIIANIASPQSAKNIQKSSAVCVSFINVLTQKGWKVKGTARLCDRSDSRSEAYFAILDNMTKGLYPYQKVFEITPIKCSEIIAPSYNYYPQISMEDRLEQAKKVYRL